MCSTVRVFVAVIAVLALAAPACGQGNPFAEKPGANDRNLGALGAGVEASGEGLAVQRVHAGGPCERAQLQAGDAITGVDGKPFEGGTDPVLAVVAAIEHAEAQKKETPVVLLVKRDGKTTPVKVPVPPLGKHATTCPKKCDKCKKVAGLGAEWLAKRQAGDGCFPTELGGKTGKVVVTSLGGLALLAAGAPLDGPVEKALGYVLKHVGAADDSPLGRMGGGAGGGNWNQTNWELSYGALFLAEVAKRSKRPDVKAKLVEVAQTIVKNQESSGGWAHGPGGPNALNYLELEILSNWSLMGLGAAKKCGADVDAKVVAKAIAWIESTASPDGGVGYSERSGQKGFGEAGRTSGALHAFALLGERKHSFFEKMAGFYRGKMKTLESGHVSPCMHLLTGALASYDLGGRDWQDYYDNYRLPIMGARKADGSFAATPTHESKALHSNTDFTVGPCWTTATYVLILSLANEKVPVLLGKAPGDKPEKAEPGRTATGKGG